MHIVFVFYYNNKKTKTKANNYVKFSIFFRTVEVLRTIFKLCLWQMCVCVCWSFLFVSQICLLFLKRGCPDPDIWNPEETHCRDGGSGQYKSLFNVNYVWKIHNTVIKNNLTKCVQFLVLNKFGDKILYF